MNYSAPMTRNAVADASVDVRMAFVRKVYGLFYASLLVTVSVGWLCISSRPCYRSCVAADVAAP